MSPLDIRGLVALHGVSFRHEACQILGLIGPNGAGITTIFNCMTRVYGPDEGSITFDDVNLLQLATHDVIATGKPRGPYCGSATSSQKEDN